MTPPATAATGTLTAETTAARLPARLTLIERVRGVPRPTGIRPSERDLAVDVVMLVLATLAVALTAPASGVPGGTAGWYLAFPVIVLVLMGARRIYTPRTGPRYLDDVRGVLAATALAAMTVTFVRVLFTDDPYAASTAVREWLFAAVYLCAGRGGVQIAVLHLRRHAKGGRRTLIVGAGKVGHRIARRLREKPEIGLVPVCFVDDDPYPTEDGRGLPVVGRDDDIEALVRETGADHAILSFSTASHEADLAVARRLRHLGVSISVVPRLFEDIPDRMALDRIGGLPVVSTYPSNPRGWQFSVKYAADRALAALAIVVSAPVLLFAAIGVLISTGRPIFFRQRRVGLDGRPFEMLKFRSMRDGGPIEASAPPAEQVVNGDIAPGGVEGEDRRTRFGTLLRSTSLDELPQLFNVLRGDMSVVGPRPERDSYVRTFEQSVHRYGDRHRVKSGITGWAQVHGLRGNTSLADRVEWDNYYIENWSLWLDFKVLLLTVLAVFRDQSE